MRLLRATLVDCRFIYAAEDTELVAYITTQRELNPSNRVVVLFPSSLAISSDDFISTWNRDGAEAVEQFQTETHTQTETPTRSASESFQGTPGACPIDSQSPRKLIIIVVVSGEGGEVIHIAHV
jgi:hypothetical protein